MLFTISILIITTLAVLVFVKSPLTYFKTKEGKLSQARGTNSPMTVYLKEKGASEYWNIWGDLKDQ